ncbi:unnamed protein product [Bemisia tabaci]|uniref:Ankyrin repeat domain-containing protein n=1 Tax=Bemisia tabaci TaxID=7038 RepID=A0A9P0ALZ2_BEMTA|nr:unnamed protein product [Bemisia tabaci]
MASNVNAQNSEGMTPLMISAQLESVLIFDILLKHNAAIELQDEAGKTALHYAVMKSQNGEIIKLLLESGANVDARDVKGTTPLFKAVLDQRLDTMQDESGETALHNAVMTGQNGEIIKLLLESGANVDARDERGRTPLFNAVLAKRLDNMQTLLEAGADVNAADKSGETPLTTAMDYCREKRE